MRVEVPAVNYSAPKWWYEAAVIVFNKASSLNEESVEDSRKYVLVSEGLKHTRERLASMLVGGLTGKEKSLRETLIEDCGRLINVYGSENW